MRSRDHEVDLMLKDEALNRIGERFLRYQDAVAVGSFIYGIEKLPESLFGLIP